MKKNIKDLIENFQVRKTDMQKVSFRMWMSEITKEMGYKMDIEVDGKSQNLVFGDPRTSKLILTAHYDTQPNAYIPIVTFFSNHLTYLISQILSLWPIVLYYMIVSLIFFLAVNGLEVLYYQYNLLLIDTLYVLVPLVLISLFYVIIPLLFVYQIMMGKENKHTVNDNTSGVSVLISIMEDLDESLRDKVCFVFFDLEEAGLVGSSKFKKKHKAYVHNIPLINFDCVSDGGTYLFVAKKRFRESNVMESIERHSGKLKKPVVFKKAIIAPYASDQLHFKNSVGVVAAKHIKGLGYYLDRIHTKRDTVFQYENIIELKDLSIKLIEEL